MHAGTLRRYAVATLFALTASVCAPTASAAVLLDAVAQNSYLYAGGLRSGDRIERFRQVRNGKRRAGPILDPLSLATLEVFGMAPAPVELIGRRGGHPMRWRVASHPDQRWGFSAQLPLPAAARQRFAASLTALANDSTAAQDAARDIDAAIDTVRRNQGPLWAAWLANDAADAAASDVLIGHFRKLSLDDAHAARAIAAATLLHLDYAKAEARRGHWPAAFAQCRAALGELAAAGAARSLPAAEASYLLGAMYARRGKAESAQPLQARAEAIYAKQAPNYWQRAVNAIEQGALANAMHNRDAAVASYERAVAVFRAGDPGGHWVLNALTSLAIVEDNRGNLTRSHALLIEAAPLLASMPDGQLKPSILRNFAAIEADRGDFAGAERHLHESIDIAARFPRNDGLPTSAICDLADLLRTHGDLNEALNESRRCVDQNERYAAHGSNTALALLVRSRIERDLGRLDSATADARRALDIQRSLAGGRTYSAEPLLALAEADVERGQFAPARKLVDAAHRVISETHAEDSREEGLVAHADGLLRRAQGDLAGARTELQRALDLSRRYAPNSVYEAQAHHDLGLLLVQTGDTAAGRSELCDAADVLERQVGRIGGGGEDRGRFLNRVRAITVDCADAQIRSGDLAAAFLTSERGRARGLLQLINERNLEFSGDKEGALRNERQRIDARYDDIATELAQLHASADSSAARTRLAATLAGLRDQRADLTRRLRERSPHLSALTDPQPLGAMAAAAQLDPGSVLVDYLLGRDGGWIFVLPAGAPQQLHAYRLNLGERELRDRVDRFRNLIAGHDPNRLAQLEQVGAVLYAHLLQPAEAQLASADRILVAADGPLTLLPFVALRRGSGDGAEYLVAWKPMTQIASITIFAENKARREPPARSHARVAAFGDPDFTAATLASSSPNDVRRAEFRNLPALPATRHEIAILAKLYARTRTYLGGRATEAAVKAAAPRAGILHLATHGYFDAHVPLDSGLLLATPATVRPGEDNGILQTWEILESLRTSADLVTLSACDTALGEEEDGEGLLGLTRAFEFAGAHSVLASLWDVPDDSTSVLMEHFYRALAAGMSKDRALRTAQLALIERARTDVGAQTVRGMHLTDSKATAWLESQPYAWAGFQLYGDWR